MSSVSFIYMICPSLALTSFYWTTNECIYCGLWIWNTIKSLKWVIFNIEGSLFWMMTSKWKLYLDRVTHIHTFPHLRSSLRVSPAQVSHLFVIMNKSQQLLLPSTLHHCLFQNTPACKHTLLKHTLGLHGLLVLPTHQIPQYCHSERDFSPHLDIILDNASPEKVKGSTINWTFL